MGVIVCNKSNLIKDDEINFLFILDSESDADSFNVIQGIYAINKEDHYINAIFNTTDARYKIIKRQAMNAGVSDNVYRHTEDCNNLKITEKVVISDKVNGLAYFKNAKEFISLKSKPLAQKMLSYLECDINEM